MSAFLHVVKKAEEKDPAASILVEQVENFAKKKPTRSEKTMRHVVLRNLSTRTYKHARSTGILRLPCRSTLERFMGSSRGEVGVTKLVKQRLSAELASRLSLRARTCSSIVDEMRVKKKRLLYYAQRCLHRRGDGLWCQLPPKKQQMSLSWPTHFCVSSLTAFQFRSRYPWHIRFREKLH